MNSTANQEINSQNQSVNPSLEYGYFHCTKLKDGKKCDICSHIREIIFIFSHFYQQNFRIYGHLAHDQSSDNTKRWLVYAIEDQPCKKTIIESTSNPTQHWRNHKSSCNKRPSLSTGLAKHFTPNGWCPNDTGRDKMTLNFTLLTTWILQKMIWKRLHPTPWREMLRRRNE